MEYEDIVYKTLTFTNVQTLLVSTSVNKLFYSVSNNLMTEKVGTFTLHPYQTYCYKRMIEKQKVYIKAPLSAGKTVMGLSRVFYNYDWKNKNNNGVVFLVIVPPKTLDTWMSHVTKMFDAAFEANSKTSTVFCLNKRYSPIHQDVKDISVQTRLILASTKVIDYGNLSWYKNNCTHIMMDEGHKTSNIAYHINQDDKIKYLYLLSADKPPSSWKNDIISININSVLSSVPNFRIEIKIPTSSIKHVDIYKDIMESKKHSHIAYFFEDRPKCEYLTKLKETAKDCDYEPFLYTLSQIL